jgi:transcriptional regulator with XRE-family HTH domain
MELGSRLKKAREVKRLSQQDVAHLLGVSQKTLSNIESGKSIPNIFQLAKMGKIYELDLLDFLAEEGIVLTNYPSILPKSIIMFSNLNKKLIQN